MAHCFLFLDCCLIYLLSNCYQYQQTSCSTASQQDATQWQWPSISTDHGNQEQRAEGVFQGVLLGRNLCFARSEEVLKPVYCLVPFSLGYRVRTKSTKQDGSGIAADRIWKTFTAYHQYMHQRLWLPLKSRHPWAA